MAYNLHAIKRSSHQIHKEVNMGLSGGGGQPNATC
jgi:hypothetical protein